MDIEPKTKQALENMFFYGVVCEQNPAAGTARVTREDKEGKVTAELMVLQRGTKSTIFLSKQYGIDPKKQYEELKTMCETGAVFPLILGGRPVSQNYWTLRSLSLSDVYYTPTGKMHTAKVSVKLKEYDDSNYTEEKTKVDLYGSIGNAITGIF